MNAVARPELATEAWAPCSTQQMVLAFLQAEWDKWPQLYHLGDRRLITPPEANLGDVVQNSLRASLLWQVRGFLFKHVPSNTEWHEVRYLRGEHFWQLLNIHHTDWSQHATNRLEEVALVRVEPLLSALAGAAAERQNWRSIALVGLSAHRCGWHRPDGLW
jgi:hypothetical protein